MRPPRLLRYVWLPDNQMFNEVMIREGFAKEYTYRNQAYKYRERFQKAEREARESQRGFWGPAGHGVPGVTVGDGPSVTPGDVGPTPPGGGGRVDPISRTECPATHQIKGNRPSKIYHVPGGRDYARTGPEDCYRSPTDAEAAGYRAAGSPSCYCPSGNDRADLTEQY